MKDAEDEAFDELAKRQGHWGGGFMAKRAMAADKLQEPAQEPVAWMVYTQDGQSVYVTDNPTDIQEGQRALPLYTAPPQRPWVGLTDEEIKEIVGPWGDTPVKGYTRKLFDQIEAKLRSKNT